MNNKDICWNFKKIYVYTFAFSENYKTQMMPCWEVTHRSHNHTVAKFKCELSPLHTLVKNRKQNDKPLLLPNSVKQKCRLRRSTATHIPGDCTWAIS